LNDFCQGQGLLVDLLSLLHCDRKWLMLFLDGRDKSLVLLWLWCFDATRD